jgi:serine protease Do
VAGELTADQKRSARVESGVVIEEVRAQSRADIRVGDIIVALTAKGQTTELKSADQFNNLLAQFDRNTTITLQLRRGEANLFVTVRIEDARG